MEGEQVVKNNGYNGHHIIGVFKKIKVRFLFNEKRENSCGNLVYSYSDTFFQSVHSNTILIRTVSDCRTRTLIFQEPQFQILMLSSRVDSSFQPPGSLLAC